jgi:8-oxo-dGTP diphosphatase
MKKINDDSLATELEEGSGILEGVEVAILNEKNQILLGKRLASAGYGTWNFPGGHLKAKERIAECAEREVSEELGEDIDVEITDEILSIRENCIAPQYIHHLTILIKGIHKKGEPKVNEPDKCEKWEWFDLDNLPSPLFPGIGKALEIYKKGKSRVVSEL